MTDDLVSRLRNAYATPTLCNIAADRIETLEKEVEEWKKRCLSVFAEMISLLADTAAERSNIRAIFENESELFVEEKENG